MLCLGVSFLIAVISIPLWRTVSNQIRLMAGVWDPVVSRSVAYEINRQYKLNRYLLAPRDALWMADAGQLSAEKLEPLSQQDSDNDLYRYLRILLRLREVATTTRPAQVDADLERLLRQRTKDRKASLHLTRRQELVRTAAASRGLSMRASAVLAGNAMGHQHRPALHELIQRLVTQGNQWRQTGCAVEAVLAHRAVVELVADLLNDSPTPDIALLAAQHLPEALSALSDDLKMPADVKHDNGLRVLAGLCEAQAARVAEFGERWHAVAADGRVNLLPRTAEGILASAEHDRALRSMCASVVIGFVWLVGCVITIVVLIVGAIFGIGQQSVRASGRSTWLAVAGVTMMPAVMLCWLTWADIRFEWLFSLPTLPFSNVVPAWLPFWLPGVVLAAAIVLVVFSVVSNLCLAVRNETRTVSRWALTSGVMVLFTFFVILLFWPIGTERWQPPASIQRLRVLWLVVGVVVVLVAFGWLTVFALRGKGGLGIRCRWVSVVAARTLLMISLIGFGCLIVNLRNDRLHAQVFSEAVHDPVADRLGRKDWQAGCFGGASAILDALDQRY